MSGRSQPLQVFIHGGGQLMRSAAAFHDGRQAFMSVMMMEKSLNERLLMSVQMNVNDGTCQL